jgi:hypothetical protein
MPYTKIVSRSAKVTIDGTDVSNSFSEFAYISEHSEVDASGFSAEGTDETLPGSTAQSFEGTCFNTEEFGAIAEPLHRARTACVITYQPNGLVDATREIYSGTCTINRFESRETRGQVTQVPFTAKPTLAAGITVSNWT